MNSYPNFLKTYGNGVKWKPNVEQDNDIKNAIPIDLKEFIAEFGFSSYNEGFLSVFPPFYLQLELNNWFGEGAGFIPFAHTGLGDIYFLDNKYVRVLYINYGITDIAASSTKRFFEKLITDESYIEKIMKKPYFDLAKKKYGDLGFMQAFCFEPALALGGSEAPDNLRKVGLKEHLLFLSQVIGEVRYKSY